MKKYQFSLVNEYLLESYFSLLPVVCINALNTDTTNSKWFCGVYLDQRYGLVTSRAFAIKIPSDSHVILLFKFGFDNLEFAQFFSENIVFLLAVQIIPHSDTVYHKLSVIWYVGRKNKPNDGGNKQIEVTEPVVESRISQTAKSQS